MKLSDCFKSYSVNSNNFLTMPGATLTVKSCLVDGRPSVSSSVETDWTGLSVSDDSPYSPLPEVPHFTSVALTPDHHAATLGVPTPPTMPQSRDHMPSRRSRRSARAEINFRSPTSPQTAESNRTSYSSSSSKRATKRERKVTKTLAIVLGERSPFITNK